MSCLLCTNAVARPDDTLCDRCRAAEYRRMVARARRREEEWRARLPTDMPALCFLLNVMVDSDWSERAVTGAQHVLARPEAPVPAVFAHLVEVDA